jgi:four helix bundle protein
VIDKNRAEEFRNRTKKFAIDIILFFKTLSKSPETLIIGKQLIRSATSIAANYRAVCRARSDQEFYSKLCIVVEEADETLLWLELLSDAKLAPQEKISPLKKEVTEILSIVSSSRKTMKNKLSKN